MQYHSIFNDVLGPIMCGPSSSHSAGCTRIGNLTRSLYGAEIKKAVVVYDSNGSYPSTCVGQGSNFGFTGGLLGFTTDDIRVKDSQKIAVSMGAEITFSVEPLSARHPNEARIDVYDENDQVALSVLTFSTGGGTFQIVEMDGFSVFMDGSKEQLYICCKKDAEALIRDTIGTWDSHAQITTSYKEDLALLCVEGHLSSKETLYASLALAPILWTRTASRILPVEMQTHAKLPFATCKEALSYMETHHKTCPEAALDYETSFGNATCEEIWELASHTYDRMKASMDSPDPKTTEKFGFLDYQSQTMKANDSVRPTVPVGVLHPAMFGALATMENSCAHNLVAAAPTAGSSGVIPSALICVGESMNLSKDEIINGLLCAGLAGAFIANQATFGAEVAGCQAENGSASAMAAAGITCLLGGSAEECFKAASLALQNTLGLICDPIAGLTEIPCISRNIMAMSNAVMSANMTILGFDSVVPFDECIAAMYHTGQMLPSELRCTCKGGLCLTPTACKISQK